MDWGKAAAGIGLGVLAIAVAWIGLEFVPTVVTSLNAAIAEAQIVLGFFGVTIGATTIGGGALRANGTLTTEQVRASGAVGLLGAALLLIGWLNVPAV